MRCTLSVLAVVFLVAGAAGLPAAQAGETPERDRVAYLGVATSPMTEAIATQLKLPPGVGVAVETVAKQGPAGLAGICPHDVLLKLDNQVLANPSQLASLVRGHKAKDKVTLTLLRAGEELKVTVTLGETAALPPADVLPAPQPLEFPAANPQDLFQQMHQRLLEQQQQMRNRMNLNLAAVGGAATGMSTLSDGEHTLVITTRGQDKQLLVKDREGKTLFDGPVNTEEQRRKVPPEILNKLENMERNVHVEVRAGDNPLAGMLGRRNAGAARTNPATEKRRLYSDDEHKLTLATRPDGKYLVAEDKDGKIVFEGPVNTPEHRRKVPPEILKKLEKMEEEIRQASRGEVALTDNGITVTLTVEEGRQSIVAKNQDGKVLFQGPVDTEEQRATMPDPVRRTLEKLWKSCRAVWAASETN